MSETVVLIGPQQVGKTTVGRLLAESLQMPFCDLPAKAWDYWQAAGFDDATVQRLLQEGGVEARQRYISPFEVLTLERGLQDHTGSIVETSPHQIVQEQEDLIERVQTALAPLANVFLLLPTPDTNESERILFERGAKHHFDGMDFYEHFARHHSNFDLAKIIIYTRDKSPQESCDEILARMTTGSDVVLIGPQGTGKSTMGRLLAERLALPNVSMDGVRWDYYKEIGWDQDEQNRIGAADGFSGVYRYWKRFELYAVERLLEEHKQCVIDFGAGHSVYEDDAQFAHAQKLLSPYPNVVLLLPSHDLDESVDILGERLGNRRHGMPISRFFLTRLADSGLAKHVIYTDGKTPELTRDEILTYVNR